MSRLNRSCPICERNKAIVLHRQSFVVPDGHCLPASYDIVSCSDCGFVYADSLAKQIEYDAYYRQSSKYEYSNVMNTGVPSESLFMDSAEEISRYIPDKSCAIVDIGCADGGLLATLKNMGYTDLRGIDPSKACTQYVYKTHKIKAEMGTVFSRNLFKHKQFDCVVLSHVLEHVYDLRGAVRNIRSLLKPGGISYIEVPDASRYADYYIAPYHYFDHEHINHFDGDALKNLFIRNAFSVISCNKNERKVSSVNTYPVVGAIFRKSVETRKKVGPSFKVKRAINEYVKKSRSGYELIEASIEPILSEPVIVWGAGAFTQQLLKNSSLGKCGIVAFVDNNPKMQGLVINRVNVYPPSFIKGRDEAVVICTALYNKEILLEFNSMNQQNKVVMVI